MFYLLPLPPKNNKHTIMCASYCMSLCKKERERNTACLKEHLNLDSYNNIMKCSFIEREHFKMPILLKNIQPVINRCIVKEEWNKKKKRKRVKKPKKEKFMSLFPLHLHHHSSSTLSFTSATKDKNACNNKRNLL